MKWFRFLYCVALITKCKLNFICTYIRFINVFLILMHPNNYTITNIKLIILPYKQYNKDLSVFDIYIRCVSSKAGQMIDVMYKYKK